MFGLVSVAVVVDVVNNSVYYTRKPGATLHPRGAAGLCTVLNSAWRIYERYFLGGLTCKGTTDLQG